MNEAAGSRARLGFIAVLGLTVVKLWLTRAQGVYAIGSAGHDDRLFIELAQHLYRGEWLGPYHELTLAKGPFYPLFIAAAHVLHVPLFLAQQLFYAAACALFARALAPAVRSAGLRAGVYLLLLWNPMSFEMPAMGRVLRQHVYGPLAVMMLAGLVALYLRRETPARRQLPWALLLGLAGAAFYLTREESVWIAPSLALLAGAYLVGAWRLGRAAAARAGGLLGAALLAAALPVFVVSVQNWRHYGWFGTCEFRAPEFADAYGAMLRVRAGPVRPYVPVNREAREAMAAASPRFAELQRQFDAGLARGWAANSEFLTHAPPDDGQIGGGWMMWALREATAKAGHAHSAGEALAFYGALAAELNAAADAGRLPAGPRRSGFLPPRRGDDTPRVLHTALDFAAFTVRFSRFSAWSPASSGSPEELQLFAAVARERLSREDGIVEPPYAWKVALLQAAGKAQRPVLLGLFLAAQLFAVLRLFHWLWLRRLSYPLLVAAAAWGAAAASVLIHAIIETTSFPVLTVSSFAPLYPLVLVFVTAVAWDVAVAWRELRAEVASPAPAGAEPAVDPLTLGERWSRRLPWLAGLAALAPFVIWQRSFRELFWFGDDLFLIDQMSYLGLWRWSGQVFSENFVPLFKVLWGGAVMAGGGSYLTMLWLTWLTHAVNTALFGRLLLRAGLGWPAAVTALLVFAWPAVNLETLGWSVQWSAVLAVTFLLLALAWQQEHVARGGRDGWRQWLALGLLSAASAFSFSRGVLTGPVLALAVLLPRAGESLRARLRTGLPAAVAALLPAVFAAAMIKLYSGGNHQQLGGHWGAILEFGGSYFLLNPLQNLAGGPAMDPALVVAFAAVKLAVLGGGFWCARDRLRPLLLLLLAYDLGNSLLLGIGRYHTGFDAAMSSRYQYSSLLATLPFAAALLAAALARLPQDRRLRGATVCALLTVAAALALHSWPAALREFTGWRGTDLRRLLAAPATNDPAARVPALEFMHVERAKALQRAYHLH